MKTRIIAFFLCLAMALSLVACAATEETTSLAETTETTGSSAEATTTAETTTEETTTEETTLPIYATAETTEKTEIPVEEIENAVVIHAESTGEARKVPLLVILVNYDADGDGENDWDESDPTKLYSDKTKKYYGEQWASTELTDHYDLYFGESGSVAHFFDEMTMGKICFYPIEFDTAPADSPVSNGMLELTVSVPHPSAETGNAQKAINAIAKAADVYIDFSQYDVNQNGRIDMDEMGIIVLHPGADASSSSGKSYANKASPRNYFEIWGNSQGIYATCDGVSFSRIASVGEYRKVGTVMPIGTPCHELAHNLGAHDLYNVDNSVTGGTITGWPMPYYFSLQCNGSSGSSNASSPNYLDPYHRIYLGWAEEHVVGDGVYTISSTLSGDYTVLRVNTPDPDEYYLIEIRLKEGCESRLTSGSSLGGIMIWHIDEAICRRFFEDGTACSSYINASLGERHDPGIVPLFRGAFDKSGRMMSLTSPADPFYYYSDESSTAIFDSGAFRSAMEGVQSLNSYPKTWDGAENYNLHIEVLSAPGAQMTVKITSGTKDFAPVLSATYSEKDATSITVEGSVEWSNCNIETYGLVLSTSEDMLQNAKAVTVEPKEDGTFSYRFDALTPETKYYYKVYVLSENGYAEASGDTPTNALPKEKDYAKISFFRGLTTPDKAYSMKVKYGEKVVIKFPMTKEGYTFAGWYLDEAFTTPFDLDTVIAAGREDFSLYAKWTKTE